MVESHCVSLELVEMMLLMTRKMINLFEKTVEGFSKIHTILICQLKDHLSANENILK